MYQIESQPMNWKAITTLFAIPVLLGTVVVASSNSAIGTTFTNKQGPCDITAQGGNPCVAAHSTVRSLYGNYDGPLYEVIRLSDRRFANISVLGPGDFANVRQHDNFCGSVGGDCLISRIFDQSPNHNHLYQRHKLVNASLHKIQVTGTTAAAANAVGSASSLPPRQRQKILVYGMWFDPGYGYHTDHTKGIAKGNEPESIYAVMSGTRNFRSRTCCFDYGNSENSITAKNQSDGAGAMEAIYFGKTHWMGNRGDNTTTDGPWVGADLEAGMYFGGGNVTKINPRNKPLPYPFVALYLRGGTHGFTLKGGDATRGDLTTMYDGPRPDCTIAQTCNRHKNATYTPSYQPMHKQGSIILGTGGDRSNSAVGNFYEGIIVSGVTTDETDEAVQANIVSVGYQNLPPSTTATTKTTADNKRAEPTKDASSQSTQAAAFF